MGLMAVVVATKSLELGGFCCASREVPLSWRSSLLLLLGWCWVSRLGSYQFAPLPHATGQVMSITAAERPKPSVIRAIQTSEVVGKGCLPPGGTSSRSSTQEEMSQETNWNYTFFLSWVFWLEVSPEERARPSPLSARVD